MSNLRRRLRADLGHLCGELLVEEAAKTQEFCRGKVWDNGDTIGCGDKAVRQGLCPWHFNARRKELIGKIEIAQRHMSEAVEMLKALDDGEVEFNG